MATNTQQSAEAVRSPPYLQKWKYIMVLLAFIGAMLRGVAVNESMDRTVGFAGGTTLGIAIALILFTVMYRHSNLTFISILSTRKYMAICLLAAVIGAIGIFLQGNGGAFILAYLILLAPAIIIEKIRS